MLFLTGTASQAQILSLQHENAPSLLQGQAGLPIAGASYANLFGGYATLDTLAIAHIAASNGFGLSNGNWFDLGTSVNFHKLTLSLWTSGLTSRLDQPNPTSVLQRNSNLGLQYRFKKWALYVGTKVAYQSIDASNKVTAITPTLSATTEYKKFLIGLRVTNLLFSQAQSEGMIGKMDDSTVISRDVKGAVKAPTQFQATVSRHFPLGKFSAAPVVGIGLNFNTPTEYLLSGTGKSGLTTSLGLRLGYKNKVFLQVGYKPAQESQLSQTSFGLHVNLQKVTFSYSTFNFYHFDAQRSHTLGFGININ